MASPMVEGRVDPHKKAHFSLHISDRIASKDGGNESGAYSGVKYNHKPAQSMSTRTTTLTSTSARQYCLEVKDKNPGKDSDTDVFCFTGQKSAPAKSTYILVFDPASQQATLEPLCSTYTFNFASKNGKSVSATYPHIYPKRQKGESQDTTDEDLFDTSGPGDGETDEPDPDNPYDFRHFLGAVGGAKRGDESEDNSNSPDYRTGTGSAMNTPQMVARKPVITSTASTSLKPRPKAATQLAKARRGKSPEADPSLSRKSGTSTKKHSQQSTPTVRLDRCASTNPKVESSTTKIANRKSTARLPPPSSYSKIKSAEIVHSSDDSDLDAEGSAASSPARPAHRSPSPIQDYGDDDDESEDNGGGGGLEIEVPDARPVKPRGALASLGLGQNLGLGGLGNLKSPDAARGPISLASAANSVEGSPNPHTFTQDEDTLDFGDIGGAVSDEEDEDGYASASEEEYRPKRERDGDVEPMDIGPPATTQSLSNRKLSVSGMAVEEDEDDPLYKEMMEGLAGGDSSEESEEE